ncbi:RNA polymerase sigma factor [Flavivirga eckloniae]|uniref:RNA polymerase sigma-70 factor n=1 Tax=Flavivirga eckloniae TaxID=1803846 RepID=A0A2K9PP32_9FLAO|nr:RNA polymerase sigma-70 factor [Flavivirga eckloniae]AUP78831.1 RNA polymerase sigma-70 factor [Flavivirga eckloniae]
MKESVARLKKDDKEIFKYLFNQYYKSLVGYITTYTRSQSDSEDIVQYSYTKLWENRKQLKGNISPKNYLYTIAHNRYIDLYRKSIRDNDLLQELRQENLRNRIEEDDEFLKKRIEKLKKIIDLLPPRCKEILYLSRQRGLEYKEIGNILNISSRTVEEQIRIAFKKIREAFENEQLLLFLLYYNTEEIFNRK